MCHPVNINEGTPPAANDSCHSLPLVPPFCVARPSFSTLEESPFVATVILFRPCDDPPLTGGSHFGPCIHLTCSPGAEGLFNWLEWPRSQAAGLPQLGRVPPDEPLIPTDREDQPLLRVRALHDAGHCRRGKRLPRVVLSWHGRDSREALPPFELSRTLFLSRRGILLVWDPAISGSENFSSTCLRICCGICSVHAVLPLPHFCTEQHHPLPFRRFLNSTLPAADGGVDKAHRCVSSCMRAMVIRRVGRNAHGQRNDARLCKDSIFPQSQAAIPERAILNRTARNQHV